MLGFVLAYITNEPTYPRPWAFLTEFCIYHQLLVCNCLPLLCSLYQISPSRILESAEDNCSSPSSRRYPATRWKMSNGAIHILKIKMLPWFILRLLSPLAVDMSNELHSVRFFELLWSAGEDFAADSRMKRDTTCRSSAAVASRVFLQRRGLYCVSRCGEFTGFERTRLSEA
jgi:hypothetical protein